MRKRLVMAGSDKKVDSEIESYREWACKERDACLRVAGDIAHSIGESVAYRDLSPRPGSSLANTLKVFGTAAVEATAELTMWDMFLDELQWEEHARGNDEERDIRPCRVILSNVVLSATSAVAKVKVTNDAMTLVVLHHERVGIEKFVRKAVARLERDNAE